MRTKLTKITLSATLWLVITFTLSCIGCHDYPDDDPSSNSGAGISSSGGGGIATSSSSSRPGSSSSSVGGGGVVYGTPVNYGGETYQTVVIGSQTWMARNLNYDVPGNDTDVCYDNDPDNCAIYGRLYNWATAMALPSKCDSISCSTQISAKHKGICPSGWHLPTQAEWDALAIYIQRDKGCNLSCGATHLKSTSGWNSNGNGLDSYGFAALPGGGEGSVGYWWSASEAEAALVGDPNKAWLDYMDYIHNSKLFGYGDKSSLLSVRCVQD